MSRNTMAIFITAVTGVIIFILIGRNSHDREQEQKITVLGQASGSYAPDEAVIIMGVESLGPGARHAQRENREKSAKIMEALKKSGVSENQISSSGYRITEEKRFNPASKTYESHGYRVSHQLELKTDELKNLGSLVDTVVTAGVNRIHSINFNLSGQAQTKARQKVLQSAALAARKKAGTLAGSLNTSVGMTLQISEPDFQETPRPAKRMFMEAASAGSAAPAVISPGDIRIQSTVRVTFSLIQG